MEVGLGSTLLLRDVALGFNGDVTVRGPVRKVLAGDALKRKLVGGEGEVDQHNPSNRFRETAPPTVNDCVVSRREPPRIGDIRKECTAVKRESGAGNELQVEDAPLAAIEAWTL